VKHGTIQVRRSPCAGCGSLNSAHVVGCVLTGTKIVEGVKHDGSKDQRPDLLPFRALDEISKVLAHGAEKYADDNWQKLPKLRRRYLAASLRHLFKWRLGEKLDADSGLHHLAHLACDVLFILSAEIGFDSPMEGDVDAETNNP